MKPTHTGKWTYHRKFTPPHAEQFGRSHFTYYPGTKDYDEAVRRCATVHEECDREWKEYRASQKAKKLDASPPPNLLSNDDQLALEVGRAAVHLYRLLGLVTPLKL